MNDTENNINTTIQTPPEAAQSSAPAPVEKKGGKGLWIIGILLGLAVAFGAAYVFGVFPDDTDDTAIVTTDQNDNVNIPQANNSAKPPLPSSSKRSRSSVQGKQSWLLRLFESKLFDMSIAISYLFNSKEPGVQTYLGKY